MTNDGYFVKYHFGPSDEGGEVMVANTTISINEVRTRAEETFRSPVLRQAGVIVRAHIDGDISEDEYLEQRDKLANTTSNPSLLKAFMDGHYQRKIQQPAKIHVTVCD
jgi:hypothetical protein